MTKKARSSLETRLCIIMIGTLFVVLLGVGHLSMKQQCSMLASQKTEEFEATARSLALSAGQIASGSDPTLVADVRSRVRKSHLGLEYVVIADENGRTIFAESRNLPKTPFSPGMRWWMVVRRISGYAGVDPDSIYSVTVPVRLEGGKAGTFAAGFRLAGLNRLTDTVQAGVLLAIALGLIVGVVCAVLTARSIMGPLRSITQGARAVSEGKFDFKIDVKSHDEIGELVQSFNYMVETLANSHEQLVERANTDCLTGLYNHRYFQERLGNEVSRAARYGSRLSMLMIDIDFFKSFNDEYGHPLGDLALASLAKVLVETVREIDIPVRYGGEEFAVILPETSVSDAVHTAERIRAAVENYPFTGKDNQPTSLTVSIGVAEYPTHCSDRTSLIHTADVALYQAKANGRNAVACYDPATSGEHEVDPYKLHVLLHSEDVATIEALAEAVDAKLKLPAGHSRVVGNMAAATARHMGFDESEANKIYLAALLRDIGQIAVPDSVLSKTTKLNKEEMAMVAAHPKMGHAIVQKAAHLAPMLPAVLHHHEHFDGNGYPSQLSGDDIPLAARIIAVADAYQSMIITRPHRRRLTPAEAQMELVEKSGTQFDPKVVQKFLETLTAEHTREKAA